MIEGQKVDVLEGFKSLNQVHTTEIPRNHVENSTEIESLQEKVLAIIKDIPELQVGKVESMDGCLRIHMTHHQYPELSYVDVLIVNTKEDAWTQKTTHAKKTVVIINGSQNDEVIKEKFIKGLTEAQDKMQKMREKKERRHTAQRQAES